MSIAGTAGKKANSKNQCANRKKTYPLLKLLNGKHINHQVYLQFQDMICLAVNCYLFMEKSLYIFPFKYDIFLYILYTAFLPKDIKVI